MKKIWKKLVSLSLLLVCILSLSTSVEAASNKKDAIDYDESTLSSFLDEVFTVALDEEQTDYFLKMDDSQLDTTLSEYSFDAKTLKSALQGFRDLVKECNGFNSKGKYKFSSDKKNITATVDLDMKDRDAKMTIIYDENSKATSVTYEAKYTLAEKMEKAALNTLLGMGTVFVVLIFISVLISCFKFINKSQNKTAGSTAEPVAVAAPVAAPAQAVQASDDLELVAVITAAIAAAMGTTSTDGFIVRSIKKRHRK